MIGLPAAAGSAAAASMGQCDPMGIIGVPK